MSVVGWVHLVTGWSVAWTWARLREGTREEATVAVKVREDGAWTRRWDGDGEK